MNFDLQQLAVLERPHEILLQPPDHDNQLSKDASSNYEMGPSIARPVVQKSSISLSYSTQPYMCDVGAFSRPGHELYEWIDMVKLWLLHFEM